LRKQGAKNEHKGNESGHHGRLGLLETVANIGVEPSRQGVGHAD
jgi:hypothetical protein